MLFQEAVHQYLDTDSGRPLTIEEFASLYPLIHFDVSKYRDKLQMGSSDIEVRWQLASDFRNLANSDTSKYRVYCVVLSDRYMTLEVMSAKINVIV